MVAIPSAVVAIPSAVVAWVRNKGKACGCLFLLSASHGCGSIGGTDQVASAADATADSMGEDGEHTPSNPDGSAGSGSTDGASDDEDCEDVPADPGPGLIRRLTRWEYIATVRDTFDVDVALEAERWPE
ncbi:MAG: hypothetical protein V3V08_23950 [Nannocystaceae bacterium]